MTTPVRLAKRLAELVSCSRREAELFIAGGWVTVDGQVVEEPQFMVLQQKVELHPEASLTPVEPATILFHLPPAAGMNADSAQQLICADTRAADDPSGIHLLKQHFIRLTQGIPLERNASGLLVFTQDWRVARKLREDAGVLEHEVLVEVAGSIKPGGLERLNRVDHGLTFNGKLLPAAKVSWQSEARLRFALKVEAPGQIGYMCESVGLDVLAMKRLRIGRVSMSGLQPGQWRYLLPHERF